jgi:hypothetical protein
LYPLIVNEASFSERVITVVPTKAYYGTTGWVIVLNDVGVIVNNASALALVLK